MTEAAIFMSGNSQAVRLPKSFRFNGKSVEIFRRGNEVVLREKRQTVAEVLKDLPPVSQEDERLLTRPWGLHAQSRRKSAIGTNCWVPAPNHDHLPAGHEHGQLLPAKPLTVAVIPPDGHGARFPGDFGDHRG